MRALKILALSVLLLLPVLAVAPSASAARQNRVACHTNMASTRVDTWGNVGEYHVWTVRREQRTFRVRLSHTLRYWYCPDNPPGPINRPDKVMPLAIMFCVTHIDSPSLYYNGVMFDPEYFDSNPIRVNPKPVRLRASSRQVCTWRIIKDKRREWMPVRSSPVQQVWWHLYQRDDQQDAMHWMRWSDANDRSHTAKPINPARDIVVKELHRIPGLK